MAPWTDRLPAEERAIYTKSFTRMKQMLKLLHGAGVQDRQTGSIVVGKRADMVLLEDDPLEQIGAVRRARLVIKGGAIYQGEALAQAAGLASATR